MTNNKHLTIIDILKGLSILLIILFHLNPKFFPNGYCGVDVFLTITGFLLYNSFRKTNFDLNIKNFINKKILHLFKPLIITIFLTIVLGILFLDYSDLFNISRTGAYALLGIANYQLDKALSDYFAEEAFRNSFLHFWYFSVTIQIYTLYFLGLKIENKTPKKLFYILLFIIFLSSILYSCKSEIASFFELKSGFLNSSTSYYMTFPRLWEPLLGSLVASLTTKTNYINNSIAKIATILGLLTITLVSLSILSTTNTFLKQIIIVLSTCVILYFSFLDKNKCPLNNQLIFKPLIYLGTISYALYLSHMPLYTIINSININATSFSLQLILLICSIIIASLFHKFIIRANLPRFLIPTLYIASIFLCFSLYKTEGLKDYIYPSTNSIRPTLYNSIEFCNDKLVLANFDNSSLVFNDGIFTVTETRHLNHKVLSPLIHLGRKSTPTVLLIGDSHAQSSYAGLDVLFKNNNISGLYLSSIICPFTNYSIPRKGNASYYYDQKKFNALFDYLCSHNEIKNIIISQHYLQRLNSPVLNWEDTRIPSYDPNLLYKNLKDFITRLKMINKNVILIAPYPSVECPNPPRLTRTIKKYNINSSHICSLIEHFNSYRDKNKEILLILDKLEKENLCSVIGMNELYTPCFSSVTKDYKLFLRDHDHLTPDGSIYVYSILSKKILQSLIY